jgi:hypothetical protein
MTSVAGTSPTVSVGNLISGGPDRCLEIKGHVLVRSAAYPPMRETCNDSDDVCERHPQHNNNNIFPLPYGNEQTYHGYASPCTPLPLNGPDQSSQQPPAIPWPRRTTIDHCNTEDAFYIIARTPTDSRADRSASQTGMILNVPRNLPMWPLLEAHIAALDLSVDDYNNSNNKEEETDVPSEPSTKVISKVYFVSNESDSLHLPFAPSLFD